MCAFKTAVFNYAPDYWDEYDDDEKIDLITGCIEYNQIASEVRHVLSNPTKKITRIARIQNVHDLGLLLIREQLLLVANPLIDYYRVRRFIMIKKRYLDNALKYNLDPRRCGLQKLVFHSNILDTFIVDQVLLAVQVVTSKPDSDMISPSSFIEYFIDYVIWF